MRLVLGILSLIALTLQDLLVQVTADSLIVNSATNYNFSLLLINGPIYPADSSIIITFPSEYTSSLTNGARTCTTIDWPIAGASPTCSINNLVLTVTGAFPSSFDDEGFAQLDFTVSNIKNPGYVMTTGTFNAAIQDNTSTQIAVSSNSDNGLTLTPGSLSREVVIQRVRLVPPAPP